MKLLIISAALLVPAVAFAHDIRDSSHDLRLAAISVRGSNEQMCVYCHTPHKAKSIHFLWNPTPAGAGTWNWGQDVDGSALTKTTTSGTIMPTTLRSNSKRCLGCHDGSVSGGDAYSGRGDSPANLAGVATVGFTEGTGNLTDAHRVGVGAMGDSHPISIPYAGQAGYNGIVSRYVADGRVGNYYAVTTADCVSTTSVCTTAPASNGRNGAAINLIPNVAGGTTAVGIECPTCHEPHNKSGFAWLTRVDVRNTSSLCLSCHNK